MSFGLQTQRKTLLFSRGYLLLFKAPPIQIRGNSHYIQGQRSEKNNREYFYFIDHQGQLFLHDARIKNFTSCFKEKKFLQFFISRLRPNDLIPHRYPEFPFLSPCGRELNFVQCEDQPIVFTELLSNKTNDDFRLSYNCAGDLLAVDFKPQLLSMDPRNGRVYYPAPKDELGKGLVKSALAIEFSKYFVFEDDDQSRPPKWIQWNGQQILLQNEAC